MISGVRFLKPRYFVLLLASSLAVNTLVLALPLMTMQIYDRILNNHATDTLIVLVTGVLIAALVDFTLRCCRSMITGRNGAYFEHEAAAAAMRHVLETEPRGTAHASVSGLGVDVTSASRLKDYYGGQMMVTLLIDMPFILVFLGFLAYLAGSLVLVPCVVLAVFLMFSWRQGVALRGAMEERERRDADRYDFITHSLESVHSIKAMCLEASMARRFEAVQRGSGPLNYRIGCLYGHTASLSYGFSQLMTVAVLCAGAPLIIQSQITTGTLIACVLLSGQLMQPLQRGLAMWIRFQDIAMAKERLGTLFALPRRTFLTQDLLNTPRGDVVMQRVRFGHSQNRPVLEDIELTIAAGATIAIQGVAGAGRTTLLEVMAGIYTPDAGAVQIDGMNAAAIPIAQRSRYIAYLPMHGMILRGSIMDNLTGFNPLLRAQARVVAEQLGIEDTVALLPSGYDTPLEGQMTDVISPGLKQRISIAHALLHKPRLILFDQADHGMDHESYARVFELLVKLKGKATLVLVSEDHNITSLADESYMLQGGVLRPAAHAFSGAYRRVAEGRV